ncbi:hypothetical protein [uncultured Ilyobacter sp.]|uniref:hypothetical protein n=1 Tax=uncultured Ilyobacter sp. TaxID=544433 RepID=UPI002AA5FB96|nr:hypothetical protein [uncultured Ilyobacter sp.]
MKMTPYMIKAQSNMVPGKITAEGFLGDEKLNISEIITRDEGEMIRLGMKFQTVADLLRDFMLKGEHALGEPVTIENKWIVQTIEARGNLPCPFEDGIFQKISVQLKLISSEETITYTDLSLHLLEKHHFLQGKGSPFRIDPIKLKRVLCQ